MPSKDFVKTAADHSDKSLNIINYLKQYQVISADDQTAIDNVKAIKKRPSQSIWYYFGIIIFVMMLIAFVLGDPMTYHNIKATFAPNSLQAKLAEQKWIVYTASWCGFCKRQKEIIGSDYIYLTECDKDSNVKAPSDAKFILPCDSVHAYPTWFNTNTGQKLEGYQSEEQLNALC